MSTFDRYAAITIGIVLFLLLLALLGRLIPQMVQSYLQLLP